MEVSYIQERRQGRRNSQTPMYSDSQIWIGDREIGTDPTMGNLPWPCNIYTERRAHENTDNTLKIRKTQSTSATSVASHTHICKYNLLYPSECGSARCVLSRPRPPGNPAISLGHVALYQTCFFYEKPLNQGLCSELCSEKFASRI